MATVDNVIDNNTKYEELCRLCAAKTTLILAIHIFENEGAIRQLSKKIQTCLPIQVHEQDQLPKLICENCLYKLEMFFDFRERTSKTERLLLELYKEIKSLNHTNIQIDQQCVSLDHNDLIMVPHHQLMSHNLQNVSDLDLAQLGHRDGLIVEQEIILTHHTVDMNSHSIDGIELSNRDLMGQDLSNQSLHANQESLLVGSENGHDISDNRFTEENLNLMHQQLLSGQFRLQNDLQVSMVSEDNLDYISSDHSSHNYQDKSNESHPTSSTLDYSDAKLEDNSLSVDSNLNVDSHLNSLKLEIYHNENSRIQEDSSNDHNFDLENVNSVLNNKEYLLPNDNLDVGHISTDFSCNICGRKFDNETEFDSHYSKHFYEANNEVVTNNEAASFSDDEKLEIYEEKMASEESNNADDEGVKKKKCKQKEMVNKIDGQGSIEKRKKGTAKTCTECGKVYKSNYKLQEHMRKHTGEKPFKCRSCEKTFRSKIGLAQHEAKHTGKYDYSCPTCGKGFQCKSYLMVHQRVHSDIKPYPCSTCGQNFKTKQSLLDHTNRHLGVKPYICDICGRGFITKGLCRAHEKLHSGQDNRKYSCKICNKMFVSKSYLQTHLRIHTGEKPFMCEVCGKGFLTRVDLKIHSTMHTGEKSYVCEMCGKAFARRDALRCHRRSHTGERPYSCDICGQAFTQFTPMAIHKRIHTGERPYKCETCEKSFVSRSTMMAHAKKHVKTENKVKTTESSETVENFVDNTEKT